MKYKNYVADFETLANNDNYTYVWCWGIKELNKEITIGDNIHNFFKHIFNIKHNCKIYFHNLKFDGTFILNYLLKNNYVEVDYEVLEDDNFSTLITDLGIYYKIDVKKNGFTYSFIDSYKNIPLPIKKIAKTFNTELLKGHIDYKSYRSEHHKLTNEEKEYLINDVVILEKALLYYKNNNLNKITIGSNALESFKNMVDYPFYFPTHTKEIDTFIRKSYKGGFTYLNPKFKNEIIKNGATYDVNSLYPYVMKAKFLPYGEPIFYKGNYKKDDLYNLYVQRVLIDFEIKENHIPTIQIKNNLSFQSNKYLEKSNEIVELTLTSIDLELIKKHYNILHIEYLDGYKFKSSNKLFLTYIQYWEDIKINAEKNGNEGMRFIAKLFLNNLYGKFASKIDGKRKKPFLENDILKYKTIENKELTDNPIINYCVMASFITAYSRMITINAAQSNYNNFIYCDTDSIHLNTEIIPKNIEVDRYKLGSWKKEYIFKKGKFIRQKSYLQQLENNQLKVVCAGATDEIKEQINFNNFKEGTEFNGKKMLKNVKGGLILVNTTFKIKI